MSISYGCVVLYEKYVLGHLDDRQFTGGAYAPAHLTSIFEIYNTDPDPLKCGSRGIGFCINKGVSTFININESEEQNIQIFFNGHRITGKTTKDTIHYLIGDLRFEIQVFCFTELPLSQGFGLSGAGALSTALALNYAMKLNLEFSKLVNAAHYAEIINNSGLGDVICQANGGLVLRKREGGYNIGRIEKVNYDFENKDMLICVIGKEVKTAKIITDPNRIKSINEAGRKYIAKFEKLNTVQKLSMAELVKQSFNFAKESNLMNNVVLKVIKHIQKKQLGQASMIMLGNAILAIGKLDKIKDICLNYGQPMLCKIDPAPARKIF